MGGFTHSPLRDADLVYALRSLTMFGAVLHLGAHPDDEDGGMMAYLSRGLGVRAVYWSATRGEGGQNRQGPERDEALGIVRTWESLSAREVDGAEVLYGPFYDFGFSRGGLDALARWGQEDVVREIVRAIRFVQPLVVVSRWSGGPEDGHGQHEAIGLAAAEAFEAAGDPERFRELAAQGLPPWRPRKLYRSAGGDWQPGEDVRFGVRDETLERSGYVRINTGTFDPIAGRTFQELAAIAANRHRSQAMSFLPERGDHYLYYKLERGPEEPAEPEAGFFDGLDPTLAALAEDSGGGSPEIHSLLSSADRQARVAAETFRPEDRAKPGAALLEALADLRRASELVGSDHPALGTALHRKIGEFEEVTARCLGIGLDCVLDHARVTPGDEVGATVRLWNEGPERIEMVSFGLDLPDGWSSVGMGTRQESERVRIEAFRVDVPPDAELSCPYWLRASREPYRYRWPSVGPLGLAMDPPLVVGRADVVVRGQRLALRAPAVHREAFLGGFRELPLAVLPPIALEPRERREFVPVSGPGRLGLTLTARSSGGPSAGTLTLQVPEGWAVHPGSVDLPFTGTGDAKTIRFDVNVPAGAEAGTYELAYQVATEGRRYGVVLHPVWQPAPGLPGPVTEGNAAAEAFVTSPATVAVNLVDVAFVRTLRYGYVPGTDEGIARAVAQLDVDLTVVSEADLAFGDLGQFDAIAVGPHAYITRPEVRKHAGRLLEYVEGGGTLVVQVQAYGYQEDGFAPYPFRYRQPHDRVTDPAAPVSILQPDHSIMHLPNEIGPEDFDGWVQDRGLYFFGEWDRRYTPLLASADLGEEPKGGGLLVASYGRGSYVYCGYSLFRQIPAGVPGAIRLFANLLGLPEARILERCERIRGMPLLAFMDDDRLYEVARLMSERWWVDGEYLCRQGDPGGELYVVIEGAIEAIRDKEGGEEWTVFVAQEGDVVGELAVLTDMPRSASLRARGDVKVLVMRRDHFRELLREHPDLSDEVIRVLATRMSSSLESPSRSG
jgi:LmbE family N-acetylglucosaminyl deacetylase